MSLSCNAVLASGTKPSPNIAETIEFIAKDYKLIFTEEVYTLKRRKSGLLEVGSFITRHCRTVREAVDLLKTSDGISIGMISTELLNEAGNSDASEVDLRIGKSKSGGMEISYRESYSSWAIRQRNKALQRSIGMFLLELCNAICVEYAVYDEDSAALPPNNISQIALSVLKTGVFPSNAIEGIIVIPEDKYLLTTIRALHAKEMLQYNNLLCLIA